MNILVTGGAGFIGSHLVDALVKKGHIVTIVDNLSTGTDRFIPKGVSFVKEDIRKKDAMKSLFEKEHFDVVYHEAAQTLVPNSIQNPYFDSDENIMGLLSILEAARNTKVKKIIFSSSAAVYGDNLHLPLKETEHLEPNSFYGLTKRMSEKYLSLYYTYYGIHYTILRYSNVYGPRQGVGGEGGVIYIFAKLLAEGKPITIFGDGKQTRDFISVHDVVSANVAALTKGNEKICNVSTASEITLNDLAFKMLHLMGYNNYMIHYGKLRDGDICRSSLSNENAKKYLGWKPSFSLDEGLEEILCFFKNEFRKGCIK